jgi:hypothetical protein
LKQNGSFKINTFLTYQRLQKYTKDGGSEFVEVDIFRDDEPIVEENAYGDMEEKIADLDIKIDKL